MEPSIKNSGDQDHRDTPVYILTGEQGEGKTTFLRDILPGLAEQGVRIRGILAPGSFRNGIRSGFSVLDPTTGISEDLSSADPFPGCEQHGIYYFRPEGILFGCRVLSDPRIPRETDLLVIDEVGIFEMRGEIWAESINRIVAMPFPPMIWTVRHSLVDAVIERWQLKRPVIQEVGTADRSGFVRDILEEIRVYRSAARVPGN